MSNPNENVSRIVEVLLAATGKRRADLAEHLGYGPPVISKAMHGNRPWTISDLVKMADYFEVSPAVFFMDPNELVPALGDNLRHTGGYDAAFDGLLMEAR